ncbi:hypothetical protein ACB094_05G212300 [Castanea mollissima]
MELFFLCGLILSVFLVSLCCVVFLLYHNSYASLPNLPRGKMGLPFIGESLEFLSTGRKGHPEKFIYDRMAKFSSQVFKTSILGEPVAVMCGSAGNKFLFSNENKLVTTWWPNSVNKIFPSTQKSSSSKESKILRKLLPNIMKAEALQRYIGIMDTIAQRHFAAGWDGKQEVIVFQLAKRYTFWLACKLFLSIEDPKHVAKFEDPFSFLASGASNLIRKELMAIIKQRKIDLAENKASPTQDILSHMLLTSDVNGQYVNEMDIADKIIGLLIGVHDTASAAITFVVRDLAEIPDIYNELYWSANSTHRNPEFFPEPEKFEPSRFEGNGPLPYSNVPFGGGPRMCPGKEYARMEILVFMHNVVKRFNWEKLLPDEKIIVNPMRVPAKGLPVRLLPHHA